MPRTVEAMNLRRHLDVLWRFRLIVICGAVLGILLAVLAVFRPTSSGLEYRADETWSVQSTIFVTQKGFPWGRVILPGPQPAVGTAAPELTDESRDENEKFADPGRFANLGILYSYFAKSDRVRALMRPVPAPEQLLVTPVPTSQNSTEVLPLLTIETQASTAAEARQINASAIDALKKFLEDEQRQSGISGDDRVLLEVLNPPSKGSLLIGRSKTPGMVAFVLVMAISLALAYTLDNLYPRRRLVDSAELDEFFAVPAGSGTPEVSRRAS
jgi:hypothetical protein